ncbi:MAG: hypothetical protein INF84_04595 [Roseomonas sp.]|nr:hypothetical protein [Roseomonas sp.]
MPGAFLYDNAAKGAVLTSAQANVPSMPLANLQDPQPRRRARLMGSSATITADLGAEVPVDCVALLSTTLSANATIRVRLANVSSFATVLADTGSINAEAQDEAQGNVVLVLPAPVTARYLRLDLTDGAAAFMDIGLLVAGQLWRLQRGTAYGIREGRVMLDRRDRNPFTGAEFPVPAIINPRFAAFTLPALSIAEARNQHRDLLRRLGAAGDALWIAELGDSVAERNRRAIWGAVNAPGEEASTSRDSFPLASRAVRMVERV